MTFWPVVAGLALLAAAVWFFLRYQHRQLFKPTRAAGRLSPNPGDDGIDYDDVTFPGSSGRDLHGWFLRGHPDAATLLFCHGNRGNLSDRVRSVRLYHELGLNVFAFDYRGYGLSPGHPTERGLYADAMSAWRYLRDARGIAADNIVILGRSLGGGVASHLAVHTAPAAVVIEATFTSIPDLARKHYRRLPRFGLGRMRFDNAARVGRIAAPLLLVHSTEDAVIPYAHAEALRAAAPPGTQLVTIDGAHSDGHITSGERYTQPLCAFFDAHGVARRPAAGADAAQPSLQRSV